MTLVLHFFAFTTASFGGKLNVSSGVRSAIAFDLFRSSVPKLVRTFPIPLTPSLTYRGAGRTPTRPALRDQRHSGIGQAARRSR